MNLTLSINLRRLLLILMKNRINNLQQENLNVIYLAVIPLSQLLHDHSFHNYNDMILEDLL